MQNVRPKGENILIIRLVFCRKGQMPVNYVLVLFIAILKISFWGGRFMLVKIYNPAFELDHVIYRHLQFGKLESLDIRY